LFVQVYACPFVDMIKNKEEKTPAHVLTFFFFI